MRRVAIITGASAGIGAATAIRMAQAGYDLVLAARRLNRLQDVAALCEPAGARVHLVGVDVAEPDASERIIAAAIREFGRIDVVFANAGYGMECAMTDVTTAQLRGMFDTNFFASVELCLQSARHMVAEGHGGHLFLCSSCVAKFTLPSYGAYSASKAAQAHVARAMAHELRPVGIFVSSVHPVTTRTEFFDVVKERSKDAPLSDYALHGISRFFSQPADRVARAIVRSIGKPRTEIWTSHPTRWAAGFITAFPSIYDLVVRLSHRPKPNSITAAEASRGEQGNGAPR